MVNDIMTSKSALALAALIIAPQIAAAETPAAAPAVAQKPARQCFWTRQVSNFASADDRIVNVRVGVRDVYQLEMFGRCSGVDWSNKIALASRGGFNICAGLDAEIITQTSTGRQRCPVRTVRKLTPAEIEALPKRARP